MSNDTLLQAAVLFFYFFALLGFTALAMLGAWLYSEWTATSALRADMRASVRRYKAREANKAASRRAY